MTPDQEKRFNDTLLAKSGGSCWECCEFENMYLDMKQFISTLLQEERNRIAERIEKNKQKQYFMEMKPRYGEKLEVQAWEAMERDEKIFNIALDVAINIVNKGV